MLFSALTHVTVFWEVFYCALVWPRLTRPIVLLIAVAVHGGIAMFLGMITFGTMMIVANMIFIEPHWLLAFGKQDPKIAAREEEDISEIDDDALDAMDDEQIAEFEEDEGFHVPDRRSEPGRCPGI